MARSRILKAMLALCAVVVTAAACGGGAAAAVSAAATGAPSVAATAAAGSSGSAPSPAANTASPGGVASTGTGGSTVGNDRCAKFTTDQVNSLTGGSAFQTAEPSILDVPGCQWYFDSINGNVNLQILPGSQYGDWSGKPGVTAVSGVGDSAFVGPYVLGGTMAGAQVGSTFYFLTVAPSPSNEVMVAFLKQAIAQAGGG